MIRSMTRVVFLLLLLMIRSSTIVPTMFRVGLMASAHDQNDRVVPGIDEKCKPGRCGAEGPPIKFPFRKGEQPPHCGYPGFQVSCTAGGDTLIHLPGYSQPLNITYISYERFEMLIISHDCPEDVLFRLNFSSTPFILYDSPDDYYYRCEMATLSEKMGVTKIECSSGITDFYPLVEVSCLGQGPNDHVYVASTEDVDWATLPSACRRGQTISIPFVYHTGDYSDNSVTSKWKSFFLDSIRNRQEVPLTWVLPGCKHCLCTGGTCQFANSTTNRTFCKLHDTRTTTPLYSYPFFYDHDQEGTGRSTEYAILGVILGVVFIALASGIAYSKVQQHKKSTKEKLEKQKKVDKFLEDYKSLKPTRYSHADIKAMTGYWKTKLGEGGCGTVYEGELPNQTPVAVKILKISVDDGGDFINEVGTIGRIHHVNVVRLLGFCADGIHQALVYEFMPNGSLDKFIFSREGRGKLGSWEFLQGIATGIAQGIEYLHQGCDQRILHFDIKPSNILLDQNLEPRISDFGLAKLCSKDASLVSMSAVRWGTMGYIAPEILTRNSRNVSSKSDVYSYGMLLLEMVSGRRNTFEGVARNNTDQVYYPEYLYTCLKNGQEMELDASMVGESEIAKKLIMVAMWCIQWFPVNRPSMKTVIKMMRGSTESLEIPPNPFVGDDTKTENEAHVITLDTILE